MTDYLNLTGADLLEKCGADARKWAEALSQTAQELGLVGFDVDWLETWFANAMMRAVEVDRERSHE